MSSLTAQKPVTYTKNLPAYIFTCGAAVWFTFSLTYTIVAWIMRGRVLPATWNAVFLARTHGQSNLLLAIELILEAVYLAFTVGLLTSKGLEGGFAILPTLISGSFGFNPVIGLSRGLFWTLSTLKAFGWGPWTAHGPNYMRDGIAPETDLGLFGKIAMGIMVPVHGINLILNCFWVATRYFNAPTNAAVVNLLAFSTSVYRQKATPFENYASGFLGILLDGAAITFWAVLCHGNFTVDKYFMNWPIHFILFLLLSMTLNKQVEYAPYPILFFIYMLIYIGFSLTVATLQQQAFKNNVKKPSVV